MAQISRSAATMVGCGLLAGVPAGVASFVFLELLDAAIAGREDHAPWLVVFLPAVSFAIAAAYHHLGGAASRGTALVMTETDRAAGAKAAGANVAGAEGAGAEGAGAADGRGDAGVPARMAPMVLVATVVAHLFGASVGREGVALQMAGSLTDGVLRPRLGVPARHRAVLLRAALAGGFGSVFGVPWAATVFAFEVRGHRPRLSSALAATAAAWSGHLVVVGLGHRHRRVPRLDLDLGPLVLTKAALAGVVFGLTAVLFVIATTAVRRTLERLRYPPLRAALAGAVVAVGASALGRQYLSLSLPLAAVALNGVPPPSFAWLSKLGFTAVSIGGGIPGGEVTPLFVTGAALGAVVGDRLGAPVGLFAGLGFVAVFAAGAKTPLACTVMFAELFGLSGTAAALICCVAACLVAQRYSIYPVVKRG